MIISIIVIQCNDTLWPPHIYCICDFQFHCCPLCTWSKSTIIHPSFLLYMPLRSLLQQKCAYWCAIFVVDAKLFLLSNICIWHKTFQIVKYFRWWQTISIVEYFLNANFFVLWNIQEFCLQTVDRESIRTTNKKKSWKRKIVFKVRHNSILNVKFISDYLSIFHRKFILLFAVNTTCLIKIKLSDQ